jgi:hypothetical protein
MATVLYASPEDVKTAMDAHTNRADTYVSGRVAAGSDAVEGTLRRRFYPEHATRAFQLRGTCGVWLDEHELVEVDTVTVDGTVLDLADVTLVRGARAGDPIVRIEVPTAGEELVVTGVYGYQLTERAVAEVESIVAGTLTVSDSSGIGTGALLRIGTERLIVTRKNWIVAGNTTPVTLEDRASANSFTLDVPVFAGETLLIDAERMLVVDVAGSTVIVERAVDGTALAGHTAVTAVYVQRQLAVDRAVLGTTEAAHITGDDVLVFVYPSLVTELCMAESLVGIQQGRAGYARTVGSGETEQEASGRGVRDVRTRALAAHGRPVRSVIA